VARIMPGQRRYELDPPSIGDPPRTGGIRSVTKSGRWVVPPWPDGAGVHTIVSHFLRFDPGLCYPPSDADQQAYYVGYLRALDAAVTDDLTCDLGWRWYRDLRWCVARCVACHQDRQAAAGTARSAPRLVS
jgi:hypothetical protein